MSEIDIIQAIELAISHELEARKSYLELSKDASDPELQRLLQEIAQEEAGHEASLRSRLRLYQEKHLLRETVARYVSPSVCEHILKNPSLLKLGGQRRRVTVLFADICAFTSLAEKMAPEDVVHILNHFFTAMVEIIFRHEGTLDKFLGDGLMAVFGAPLDLPDAARRAAQCALDMKDGLASLYLAGKIPVSCMGIGINTGEAIVGNIGSAQRMDFTVIGDVVNVCSRIQSLTRELDAGILLGPDTYQEVAAEFELEACPPVILRGRSEPTPIYKLIGPPSR